MLRAGSELRRTLQPLTVPRRLEQQFGLVAALTPDVPSGGWEANLTVQQQANPKLVEIIDFLRMECYRKVLSMLGN